MTAAPDDLLRTGEACRLLGVSRTTLGHLVLAGRLPAFKPVGTQYRFLRRDLAAYLDSVQVPVPVAAEQPKRTKPEPEIVDDVDPRTWNIRKYARRA